MVFTIVEGVGNDVLICVLCLIIFLVLGFIKTYRGAQSATNATHTDSQNSNSSNVFNDEDADPNEEEINLYDAGLINEDYLAQINESPQKDHERTSETMSPTSSNTVREDEVQLDEINTPATRNKAQKQAKIRLQYLDDRVQLIHAPVDMPILHFKRKFFIEEMNQQKNIRLIFQGRELTCRNDHSNSDSSASVARPPLNRLQDFGIKDNCTIHCLITNMTTSPRSSRRADPNNNLPPLFREHLHDNALLDIDIGSRIMLPMFAFLLASTWAFRFTYFEYFNIISTSALIFLSLLFMGATWSVTLARTATGSHSQPAAGDSISGAAHFISTSFQA